MKTYFQIFFILYSLSLKSQIPDSILYNWNNNEPIEKSLPTKIINAINYGFDNAGKADNSSLLQKIIYTAKSDSQTVIVFDEGTFKFTKTIFLQSNITIEGKGAGKTILLFDNTGKGHLFDISSKQQNKFYVANSNIYKSTSNFDLDSIPLENKSYCELLINSKGLATSEWAMQSIGQIVKINSIINNSALIYGDFKHDFLISDNLRYRKITPITNVNFKFFSIHRIDKTSDQTNNFNFNYAVNCSIKGVESINCNMSHISFSKSYNCKVSDSYIHHAFEYGGGGKAYGVELSNTTSSCLIENNIFENLRHSILLQSGANGNVLTGNYSTKPYWNEGLLPQNSAGEIVLHGNYPFANLIEQNQIGNIVVDNSHGINGPDNMFLRNKVTLWGVYMNNGSGNNTHFIGNEITGILCSFAGNNNFILSNFSTNSDTITNKNFKLPSSLYFAEKPCWWPKKILFPTIGNANTFNIGNIPSSYRYNFDSLRALNSSENTFLINFTSKNKIDKNTVKFTFESNLQVNVKTVNLEIVSSNFQLWKILDENLSNEFLFQKYSFTDSLKVQNTTCFRWKIVANNNTEINSDTFCILLNTAKNFDISKDEFNVFPNPFCEKILINTSETTQVTIFDNTGKIILYKQVFAGEPNEISTLSLKKGIYLLKIGNDDKSYSRLIFKE